MTSTLRFTSSTASAGRRSDFPSACRRSMTMFFPSTYPSSRRPCRNASMRGAIAEGEEVMRNPIRGTFSGCCASLVGAVVSKTVISNQIRILPLICLLLPLFANWRLITDHRRLSSDDSVRPCQHVRRNRQAKLRCCLEIDHELEFRRLLDG